MSATHEPDADVEIVPMPLDRETIAHLVRLGRILGQHPLQVLAPSILRDAVSAAAMAVALELPPGAGILN